MYCIANDDAIGGDLDIVDSSFCPAAHNQFDVVPSLKFVSDFDYSNGMTDIFYCSIS